MADQPIRTATFLFADIGGPSSVSEPLRSRYDDMLAEFRRLLRVAAHNHGGQEVAVCGGGGRAFAFSRARDGLLAAVAALHAVRRYPWPAGVSPPVRIGLHTGQATNGDTGTGGGDVRRAAHISAIGHQDQILLSQATRNLVAKNLPRGVGLRDLGRYRLRDLGEAQAIFQVLAAGLPADFPPLNSLDALPNNLPRQLTSFVGRGRDMIEVRRLFVTTPLLTLTGAGGSGKTRLALQVAAEVLEEFSGGAWFVELAPISDPALVSQSVAAALNVREQPGRPLLQTLSDVLRPTHALLLLDNCEHLIGACAQCIHTLLRACPNLQVLATSREALGVAGELTYRVPSLSVPDIDRLPSVEGLLRHEAVRLFVDRAMLVSPGFRVSDQNAPAVARVSHRLDGIPLAIELAAARLKTLTVEQIAARLSDRFRLLTAGPRTALPRHQTLRATMNWSYDLLKEKERVLLHRLSVFAGGFSLEDAEAICGDDGLGEVEVLNQLTYLVDKSLVIAEDDDGTVRYRLLETVRQYAREKLAQSGESASIQTRHRDFFLRLAEEAQPHLLRGEEQWLDRLEREHDNLRAALDWSTEAGSGPRLAGLRIAGALGTFWEVRGHLTEGRERLGGVLSGSQDLGDTAERGRAFTMAGRLAFFQGDYGAARPLLEESVAVCRRLGDKPGLALALNNLGPLVLNDGNYAAARSLYEESGAIRREIGDKRGTAIALSNLGLTARCQGEYERARTLLGQCLGLFEELHDNSGKAYCLTHLGVSEHCAGNADRAGALLKESLALFGQQGNKRLVAEALTMLAGAERVQGYPQRAATLFGAAQALYDATGSSVWTVNRHLYERDLTATRAQLADDTFKAALAEGRAMAFEQAIEYALARSEDAVPTAKRKGTPGPSGAAGLLTAREREVATLVARGLSNPEIAARLVISIRTAQTHVQNILNKLGVTSRAQIAAWAVEHGLHTPDGARQ